MTSPHERLDAVMEDCRLDLGMSWRDLANKAGLSYEGLRAVRRGDRRPNALTKRRLEDALNWAHGSIDAILDGAGPTPAEDQRRGGKPTVEELEARVAELEREVAEILANRKQHEDQKRRDTA